MGYRIVYHQKEQGITVMPGKLRRTALWCLFFLLFVHMVGAYWEEGSRVLSTLLYAPGLDAAAKAAEVLAQQVGENNAVEAAVQVFREQLTDSIGCHVY